MAGLKKSPKRKDNTNPNTVLVLFLVFFVILSIGLGVWGYFGYAGQEKLREKATTESKSNESNKLLADYYEFLALEELQAIGFTLEANELGRWQSSRKEYQEGGKFQGEKGRTKSLVEMVETAKKELGADDEGKYRDKYRDKWKSMKTDLEAAQANATKAQLDLKKKEEELNALRIKIDTGWNSFIAKIKEGNKAALDASQAKTAAMEEYFKRNQDLQNLLEKNEADHKAAADKLVAEKSVLQADLKKAIERASNANASIIRISSEPHALLMDVSRGKPLWDDPLGKITKVNAKDREVNLNIGANMGVKPGLSLNVFAASWKGKAEGLFKGTLEVIQVLGPNSSRARVTSLHDADGKEIMLNEQTRGRIQREADNALKEGDLVFNMVFGARVVIAGNIHWSGSSSDSPAEQMRHLNEFRAILEHQGVKVDAYLDLASGEIKGAITPRTRFFIKGDMLKGEEGKVLNEKINAIRTEAIERGMLIISADNLANIIGHRRARSGNDFEASGFRPALPFAGVER